MLPTYTGFCSVYASSTSVAISFSLKPTMAARPYPRRQRLPPTSLQPLPACHLLRRERVPPRHRKPATPVGPKPSIEEPPASRAPAHFLPELRSLHRASGRWTDDPEGRAASPELATLAQEIKTPRS